MNMLSHSQASQNAITMIDVSGDGAWHPVYYLFYCSAMLLLVFLQAASIFVGQSTMLNFIACRFVLRVSLLTYLTAP